MAKKRPLNQAPVAAGSSHQAPEQSPAASSYRSWMGFLTLVILIAIVIGFWTFSENMINTIDRQAKRIQSLESILIAKDLQRVRLHGSRRQSESYAILTWNPETRSALLSASQLPLLTENRSYQLWSCLEDDTSSVGTFTVDNAGSSVTAFDFTGWEPRISGYFVTSESAEGSDRPTGPVVLSVPLSPGR